MSAAAPTLTCRVPPHVWFLVSAVFHYLGPSFAVLLFARLEPAGVAWLRIASAGVVFGLWRQPWRFFAALPRRDQAVVVALGIVVAAMNTVFYEAIDRLPLATVGGIEFLAPIALAAWGMRTRRNLAALALAVAGVYALTAPRLAGDLPGYLFAFANCVLFALYIALGHRIATSGAASIDRLGAAMLVATVAALPVGVGGAVPALLDPGLLAAGIGVGLSSSVIPYVCDQLAMRRLPRASFALLLALLPANAAVMGLLVLGQRPTLTAALGIALVIGGVALHRAEV